MAYCHPSDISQILGRAFAIGNNPILELFLVDLNGQSWMMETLDQFTRKLTDSGLISAAQLKAFCDTLPPDQKPVAADQLSCKLIEKNVLTEYQAAALSSGAASRLVVGDYVILEKVGEGGMGVVFKAQHRRMKRTVALKMLSTKVGANDTALGRFEREVEVAAMLHHPNIVAALDAREEQGRHYLVMEYVEGRALSTMLEDEGQLPVDKAVDYVMQAATGCAHAHEQGVIHRDIKPSNVLVDKNGVVKILDMGLARVELSDSEGLATTEYQLTNAGTIMGTLDYISPEQALNFHSADHRTDIYSLGCTFYHLLVGQPMYAGDTPMEKLVAHREQPIPSLCAVREDVPASLESIYLRMVAKRSEDRFQSMSEVIGALQAFRICPVETHSGAPIDVLPVAARTQRSWKQATLLLFGRCGGAILGGMVGANLGGLVGGLASAVVVVFYLWFGWRCGGGYAWTYAYIRGWSQVPPERKAGKLFQVDKLKLHAVVVLIGGLVGVMSGEFWCGVFIALTVFALVDRFRMK